MRDSGVILDVSVTYDRASIREIEVASSDDVRTVVEQLLTRDDVSEALSLQTCSRAEAYVVADNATDGCRALNDFAPDVRDGNTRHMDREETLRRLMRVVSELESLVLGENQIPGQVEAGVEAARGQGTISPMLESVLMEAVHTDERVRDEMAVSEGAVSLGSAAVRLTRGELDAPISEVEALVAGAGEMGTLAAKALASIDVDDLVVANRMVVNARHLTREIPGVSKAVRLDDLDSRLCDVSLVITAMSDPDYVVTSDQLGDAGETMLIDIAQPRDIGPGANDFAGIRIHDTDDLGTVIDRTAERRERAASEVEAMIDEEFNRLLVAYKHRRADETISSIYKAAGHIKRREVSTALSGLESQGNLTDEQYETVGSLADALVGQILAAPTESLRDAAGDDDWTIIQIAVQLLNPDFGDLGASESAGSSGPSIEFSGESPEDLNRKALEGEVPRRVLE